MAFIKGTLTMLAGIAAMTVATVAQAAPSFDFQLIDTSLTGASSGTVVIRGRVINTGDETLTGYVDASAGGSSLDPFVTGWRFGGETTNLNDYFIGFNLLTGEAFDFDFYTYEYSGAPAGIYSLLGDGVASQLTLLAGQTEVEGISYDRSNLTVVAAAVVPEPATWGLMFTGFAMIGAAARRRKTWIVA